MNDSRGVNVLQTAQDLVKEEFNVILRQILLRLDYGCKICLHQLSDNVDLVEALLVHRFQDCLDAEYILMV